jgi:hypothetical protein
MAAEPPDPQGYNPPPHQLAIWSVIGLAALLVVALMSIRTDYQPNEGRTYPSRALIADAKPRLLPSPPMDDEYLPCSDCHEDEPPNPAVRELEDEHDSMEFLHGDLWCLHCHDLEDREQLHLADGSRLGFDESWRLCTQCHPEKLPDWRAGVHGKRTGSWRGVKEYRTCVSCHNPHRPPFEKLEPEPAPLRPTQIGSSRNAAREAADEES